MKVENLNLGQEVRIKHIEENEYQKARYVGLFGQQDQLATFIWNSERKDFIDGVRAYMDQNFKIHKENDAVFVEYGKTSNWEGVSRTLGTVYYFSDFLQGEIRNLEKFAEREYNSLLAFL